MECSAKKKAIASIQTEGLGEAQLALARSSQLVRLQVMWVTQQI